MSSVKLAMVGIQEDRVARVIKMIQTISERETINKKESLF